jgi:hypothetical protein
VTGVQTCALPISSGGKVAVVRGGTVWAGLPGKLRRLAVGSEPSWSPSGSAIAATQGGWVVIIGARGGRVRRLARGSAPAFSPDGRSIAYVAPDDRLMIIPARGGHATAVGHIRALSVDWQPKPRGPNPGCAAPPGSTVMASTSSAIVTGDGLSPPAAGFRLFPPLAYMGCLRKDGRERLLERRFDNNIDGATWIGSAVLAPPYAALVEVSKDSHYGGGDSAVQVFDLRTGERRDLGGESAGCPEASPDPGQPVCGGIAQVLLGSDGVSAARNSAVAVDVSLAIALSGVACVPAGGLCVAVDGRGGLFTSGDAGADSPSWSSGAVGTPSYGPDTVACPSQSLCVGPDYGMIYASTDPAGGASAWTSFSAPPGPPPAAMNDVSCPTAQLCVITRLDGGILTSTDPAAGAQAWTAAEIDPNNSANAIVCSTEPRCFVSDSAGKVFTSSDPTGGPSAWPVSPTTPRFSSGACPTVNLCVTVDDGKISTTTDPATAAWTTQSTVDDLFSVSCPSSSLCVAVGEAGALDVTTDPASGTWLSEPIDGGGNLTSVSCSSSSLCVATDVYGHVFASTNPAGGSWSWSPMFLDGDPCTDGHACSIESIEASDKTGVHTVDSSELPGSGPFLTGLTLNGDTLSWSHDGSPRSVELTLPG